MQPAHHRIGFASIASLPQSAQAAIAASGWRMDSPENLMPLPADRATYLSPPNSRRFPMHNGSHPVYDAETRAQLSKLAANHAQMDAAEIRAELARVEAHMTMRMDRSLEETDYHDKLR